MNKFRKIISLCRKYNYYTLAILAVIIYIFSTIRYESNFSEKETRQVQEKITQAQEELETYAKQILKSDPTSWIEIEDFPKDMVIYRYNSDTLQSWINLFPVGNDDVDSKSVGDRMLDTDSKRLYSVPLSRISNSEQYMKIGVSWYVTRAYKYKKSKVITGLKIKDEYLYNNKLLKNKTNSRLCLDNSFTTIPVNRNTSDIVYGKNGAPLFSIVNQSPSSINKINSSLKWIANLILLFSLIAYHIKKRSYHSFIYMVIGLQGIKILTYLLYSNLEYYTEIFSPALFADNFLFSSLGDLLITNLLVSLFSLALYIIRKRIHKDFIRARKSIQIPLRILMILTTIALILYIHYSIVSLITNSDITLQLFKLESLDIFSILIYLSYSMSYFGLLICIQFCLSSFSKTRHISLYKTRNKILYILIVSLYSILIVNAYSYKNECYKAYVWTNKLASQRDISLEVQLKGVERHIMNDHYIRQLIDYSKGEELILNRIIELYLRNVQQKYYITMTICESDKMALANNFFPIDCNTLFKYKIANNRGISLSKESCFYYLNNYKDEISYLGNFRYKKNGKKYNLYLELNSKKTSEDIGYPSLLVEQNSGASSYIPAEYSYARYYKGKLSSYRGQFNYASSFQSKLQNGFHVTKTDGYTHFANRINKDTFIVISRPSYKFFPYIISYSYTFLVFGAVIMLMTRVWHRRDKTKTRQKSSFRNKISTLVISTLVISLICMGIGSVFFTIELINDNNHIQMDEKLKSVQSTLNQICRYSEKYTDINTREMYNAMEIVANNTHIDLNLFDPYGRLIRSTRPEVYDQFLFSRRVNPEAYHSLVHLHKRKCIIQEQISDLKYYSLYAPIFNERGTLIAIANIPYFANSSGLTNNAPAVIATIINLYIIIMIISILGATAVSNSITKPLLNISKKMKYVDLLNKFEHIEYSENDELGSLVKAYNLMLDDLRESTIKLAQNEREQAWKEMARQIAHEIKNPLTPMKLSIQYLMRMKQQGSPLWQEKFDTLSVSLLEQIEILSNTASEFSSFAKFYNEDSSVVDLQYLIKEQFTLFDTRENIRFYFESDVEQANIYAKKSQISRVLVNIISNAIQAIENNDSAVIKIRLSAQDKNYVLKIEDNGEGISEENISKLFKPNFTTKSSGTGLGLAICKGIIEQSQGTIRYSKSEELHGACFTIELPIY